VLCFFFAVVFFVSPARFKTFKVFDPFCRGEGRCLLCENPDKEINGTKAGQGGPKSPGGHHRGGGGGVGGTHGRGGGCAFFFSGFPHAGGGETTFTGDVGGGGGGTNPFRGGRPRPSRGFGGLGDHFKGGVFTAFFFWGGDGAR